MFLFAWYQGVSGSCYIQPCFLCSPINFVVVSDFWQTEVVSSRLRHSCHRLLVPSSRRLGVDQRQLLRNSDVRKPHFEGLGAALNHYFWVRHPVHLFHPRQTKHNVGKFDNSPRLRATSLGPLLPLGKVSWASTNQYLPGESCQWEQRSPGDQVKGATVWSCCPPPVSSLRAECPLRISNLFGRERSYKLLVNIKKGFFFHILICTFKCLIASSGIMRRFFSDCLNPYCYMWGKTYSSLCSTPGGDPYGKWDNYISG